MDSVPRIVKSMVPSGIKKELRRIQDKSYSKTSASDVFTIGTNLLFSLSTSVDGFCITDKKVEYDIPFSSKGTRFNLQIDKIAYHNIKSGKYQIKVKKGNSYLGINTLGKGTLLTGTLHDISFSIMIKNSQLYLEILNSKDSNVYLLNKKTEILPFVTAKVDYVNEKFVGIVSERKIHLKNVFFENGLGKKVTVKFWKNRQDIILEWQSHFQNELMSNENIFFLMGTVIEDNSEHQIIFKFEGKNKEIITRESCEFDHEFVNRIILHNNFLAFSHSTKEIAPFKLSKKLVTNKNQIIFTLASENIHKIISACCVVKKSGQVEEIPIVLKKDSIIINGDSLLNLPIGYVVDLYVCDEEGYQHRLIDRNQKKLCDLYRHHLVRPTDGTKTYVYYTKTGRVSFFRSKAPIELVKAKEGNDYFEIKYSNRKLYVNSNKQYEAILQTNDYIVKKLPVDFNEELNIIDLSKEKFIDRHNYQILLKEKGNHNYNYVNTDVINKEKNTELVFMENSLSFMNASPLKLSIIVTFYNTQKYLNRLFNSLLNQGLAPTEYEVLAVNDCSTDKSRQIAEKFAKKYSQFRIIDHKVNKGLGEARNTGIKNAKAKYLTFVDGDDYINENAYRNMLNIIMKTGSQIITGGVKRFRNNKPEISWVYRKVFIKNIEKTTIKQNPELVYDTTAWNKIYDRQWFINEKFQYPTMLYEDIPVTIPAFNRASSIDIYADDMYFWFIRNQKGDESITNNRTDILNFTDRMKAIKIATKSLQNNPDALFEYEQKVLTMDIPMYLRHFNHVSDEYRNALSEEISWILNNFTKSAFEILSIRDTQRMELTANGDFNNLFELYEEGELAE